MCVGKHIVSDTFSVGGNNWDIYFYPNEINSNDNPEVRAIFKLMLVDHSEKGNDKVHSHFERPLDGGL